MNNYLHNQYLETRSKFEKLSGRLERSQERGEFQRMSPGKQRFLLNRVRSVWEKLRLLEVQLKICTAGVSLALVMMVSNVNAQDQFVQSSGQNPMPPPTIYGWSPVVADLDADGDLDFFITSWDYDLDPRILYFKNEGSNQVPDFVKAPDNENPFRALTGTTDFQSWDVVGIGDVDNDGDVDMLSYDYPSETGFLFHNLGGNETPLFSEEALDFDPAGMDLGDMDGDGDLDLVQVTYDGTVVVLPNTGDADNFNINPASPVTADIGNWNHNIEETYFTKALDLDGDGDLDLAFGAYIYDYDNNISNWFLLVAENTPNEGVPVFALVDDADNPYMNDGNFSVENLSLGDMDGDGDFDLVLMDYGLGMVYLEMDNGLVENRELVQEFYDGIMLPFNYYAFPQFADLDGDGDQDLMAINPHGNWEYLYFEYQETGQQLKYVKDDQQNIRLLNDPSLVEYTYYVDMDGDGDLDVMSVVYDPDTYLSEFHYFENTGTAQDPVYQAASGNPVILHDYFVFPSFADIDGDGDTDLFISYQIWDVQDQVLLGVTSFYENDGEAEPTFTGHTGSGNPIDQVREENFRFDYIRVNFGDIDEDGDLDAVFNDYDGLIYYLENTGTVTQPNFVDKSDTSPFANLWAGYYGMINLVDIDGDADLDLMIHYPYSRMLTEYFMNTGYKGSTGITPVLSAEGLELFPNPVTSELNIKLQSDFRGTVDYEIMNVLGKQVVSGTIDKPDEHSTFSIAAADLDAGIYMIRIRDGDNRLYLSKFVKQ